jgi:hypothetical protein
MPEHDETDAPELAEEEQFFDEIEDVLEKRRQAKRDRWAVEDKVVDSETK